MCYNVENETKGAKIMSQQYRYWSVELENKNCVIDLRTNDNVEALIEETSEKLKILESEKAELKKKRDKAMAEERASIGVDYLAKESQYMETKSVLSKLEEHNKVHKRNKDMCIKVQRLKDKYSRKESVRVVLLIGGVEDARLNSTSTKIKDDIYKLEEYGVYLTPPYYDELAKIIRDIYFDIEVEEGEFIDNDIPTETVKAIVKMCISELEGMSDEQKKEDNITGDDYYYNIPVKIFRKWYESSAFRRFSLTSIKEALIIHNYARSNKGRNEYTLANVGKVVSLNKAELEKVTDNEQ